MKGSGYWAAPEEGAYHVLLESDSGVENPEFEQFLFDSAGPLAGLGEGTLAQGSAIKQEFTANAGDILTFRWNFLTDEPLDGGMNDFAFFSLSSDDRFTIWSVNRVPAMTATPSEADYERHTGFKTFEFNLVSAGNYTLALGVVDVGDINNGSALLVDSITVVPEPWACSLLAGITLLGVAVGRRVVHRPREQRLNSPTS